MKEKIVYSDLIKVAWKGLISQIWLLTGLIIGFTIILSLLLLFSVPGKGETISISGIIILLFCVLLSGLFSLGFLKNILQALDEEEPQFSAYGQASGKLFSFLLGYLLFSIAVTIGFALFILPGVYLFLRLQFFFASMVDEETGLIVSFQRSWQITKNHTLQLFVVMLLQALAILIGLIALGIGIFVAVPMITLLYGYAYRKLIAPTAQ